MGGISGIVKSVNHWILAFAESRRMPWPTGIRIVAGLSGPVVASWAADAGLF